MRATGRGAIALCLIVAMGGIGAARVPSAVPEALCIPVLLPCSTPSPTPTPSPSPTTTPGNPLGGLLPLPDGATPAPDATTPPPAMGIPDTGAPTFTLPAAQLGGSSITFSGLKAVSVVTVPLVDGTRTTALKLEADTIVINDFMLDVRKATGPSLVTTSTTMELHGHVQVYVDSVTATLLGGVPLTLGADTPPPGNELPSTLLRVNLGLVGVTADSIVFTAPHQDLKA
jgi:hypothetical protein